MQQMLKHGTHQGHTTRCWRSRPGVVSCTPHSGRKSLRSQVLPRYHSNGYQPHSHAQDDAYSSNLPEQQSPELSGVPLAPAPITAGRAKVPVQFVVPEYVTQWGQVLKVVGSLDELGSWKVEQAPAMEWHEGHTWTLNIQLPIGEVNFKVVMQEPQGSVRWEEGSDRQISIPDTTPVSGAPVGQASVTCNFNDVHNSRVEVRPDRNFMRQQLKAVEGRVMAIQEKKRKLDKKMAALAAGFKKYDETVALLEGGVQEAVEARQQQKEAAYQQQQREQQAQQQQQQHPVQQQQPVGTGGGYNPPPPANSSNGRNHQQQQEQEPVPAEALASLGQNKGGWGPLGNSIQVPILDPSELPSFSNWSANGVHYTTASAPSPTEASEDAAGAAALQEDAQPPSAAETAASAASAVSVSSAQASVPAHVAPGMNAIKQSHVNETVLSATVDQLLAAAEDALARSSSTGNGSTSSSATGALQLGAAGVDDSKLAEEYVGELLAAAAALEQQADQRATLLLEAAKQAGNNVMAADLEQLTAASVPKMPSVDEITSATVSTNSSESAVPAAASVAANFDSFTPSITSSRDETTVPPARTDTQVPVGLVSAATKMDSDGAIIFSADELSVDVDANQLLAAVMDRIGIPLSAMGPVTITATFRPNSPSASASESLDEDMQATDQQQAAMQQGSTQQQDQGNGNAEPVGGGARYSPISPADAIAVSFSSMDGDSEAPAASGAWRSSGGGASSHGSNGSSNSSSADAWAGRHSNGYSSVGKVSRDGIHGAAASAGPYAAANVTVSRAAPLFGGQDVEQQVACKEAARQAAAEKVAAALAHVEEVRRSVMAASSQVAGHLHGLDDGSDSGYFTSPPYTATPGDGSSSSSSEYSSYRIAYRSNQSSGQVEGASKAAGAPRSMPTVGAAAVWPASHSINTDAANTKCCKNAAEGSRHGDSVSAIPVQGWVNQELSALAALAASVQSYDGAHWHDNHAHQQEEL